MIPKSGSRSSFQVDIVQYSQLAADRKVALAEDHMSETTPEGPLGNVCRPLHACVAHKLHGGCLGVSGHPSRRPLLLLLLFTTND